MEKWLVDAELVEHLIDGLRKAGLDVPTGGADCHRASRRQAVDGSASTPRSIAVLPFANLSADKEQEYFSDGLAEEIINLLAQCPG